MLRKEDVPALLVEEKKPRDGWLQNGFAIAAADLQPEHAQEWLRDALNVRIGGEGDRYSAVLAATLWRIVGESEMDYLADWFFGLEPRLNFSPGYGTIFLRQIKGVRAPADRKLVARLVDDKRLLELDHHSVRGLVETVNEWTVEPVVSRENLWTWIDHRLPMSERNMKIVADWRAKLKQSRVEWDK